MLRLGHRPQRDKRVTTHVALVARAFGAKGIYIQGDDRKLIKKIEDVINIWGGKYFRIEMISNPRKLVKDWKATGGKVVHLTMYGINLPDVQEKIRELDKILVIVGAEKVEGWYYHMADFNVAISNQPHSEVASLALFLDRLYKGEQLNIMFGDGKISVIPMERGKKVTRRDDQ